MSRRIAAGLVRMLAPLSASSGTLQTRQRFRIRMGCKHFFLIGRLRNIAKNTGKASDTRRRPIVPLRNERLVFLDVIDVI